MSNAVLLARVGLLQRARGAGLLVRMLIIAGPVAAIVCTHLAAAGAPFVLDLVFLDSLIVVLALVCVAYPDGHLGMVVLALLTAEWLSGVDDPATPWALALATSFLVFHTSLAAAAVAPPSARWTPAMCRRWLRRAAVLMAASVATTGVVIGAASLDLAGSGIVLAAALALLTIGGLWAAGRGRPEPLP